MDAIIFDLDDTLVDTSDVYWNARTRFVELLATEGIDQKKALETFEANDEVNMRSHGFAPERYLFTMMQTYRGFAKSGDLSQRQSAETEIKAIGESIWLRVPALIDGAVETLMWARRRFRLCLLSRGVEPVQMRKLEHHGLKDYFEMIRIVPRKTYLEFREMTKAMRVTSPDSSWAVGDSIRSDINPGIEAGLRCILYLYTHHSYHWRQEYGISAKGPFYKVTSLRDVIRILENPNSFSRASQI